MVGNGKQKQMETCKLKRPELQEVMIDLLGITQLITFVIFYLFFFIIQDVKYVYMYIYRGTYIYIYIYIFREREREREREILYT